MVQSIILTTVTAILYCLLVLRSMRATSLSPSPTTVCSTTSAPLTLGLWGSARGEGERGRGEGGGERGERRRRERVDAYIRDG